MSRLPYTSPLRVAFVGLGRRGLANMCRYLQLPEARVAALCDMADEARVAALEAIPVGYERTALYASWQEMLASGPELDLIYISTDWTSHTPIAVTAMKAGYNVAVEVPAVIDPESSRLLVDTVRSTGRFFTMVENCCYDPFHLSTLALVEAGILGDITHCEGAYIHDLRNDHESGSWLAALRAGGSANPYPTHGLGPICQLIRAADSADRLDKVVSMGPSTGSINSSLIHTRHGRSILLQLDVTTPRPYSRLQTVCGTRGFVSKYPMEMAMLDGMSEPVTGAALRSLMDAHRHPLLDAYEADGLSLGVANMMNYIMDRRIIDLLRAGMEPDITVEDAVEWSSLAWLTRRSLAEGSRPVAIDSWR